MAAVRELLSEGSFHETAVEQVAERAGVSRATLYQHFRSRLDLIDAICETFDANPVLQRLRQTVVLPDPDAALNDTIELSMQFWAIEDSVLAPLYGVEAIDPAARDLVERQRADRRSELQRLAHHLHAKKHLRTGVSERRALDLLMVFTSYETFRELRFSGLTDAQLTKTLQETARAALLTH
jgi:AcrR family transcriptional regulator